MLHLIRKLKNMNFTNRKHPEYSLEFDEESQSMLKWPKIFKAKLLKENSVEEAKLYFEEHVSKLIENDHDGFTILHFAVWYIHDFGCDALEKIIDFGYDVNAVNKYGQTPFFLVMNFHKKMVRSRQSHYRIVKKLIEAGADLKKSFNTESVVHTAVRLGYRRDVTKLLLDAGCDIDSYDDEWKSPVYYAFANEDFGTVKLLLKADCNVKSCHPYLHIAVRECELEIVGMLLNRGVPLEGQFLDGLSALCHSLRVWICYQDNPRIRRIADTFKDSFDKTRFKRQLKCVKMLVDYGANKNKLEELLLIVLQKTYFITFFDVKVVDFFLRCGATLNFHHHIIMKTMKAIRKLRFQFVLVENTAMRIMQNSPNNLLNFNEAIFHEHATTSQYYLKCLKEVRLMKKKLFYRNVSIFDLLSKEDIRPYIRNKKMLRIMNKKSNRQLLKYCYPIYYEKLISRVADELEKESRYKKAKLTLSYLFNWDVNSYGVIFSLILKFAGRKGQYTLGKVRDIIFK